MGLASDLGYSHSDRGQFHRLVTRVFSTRVMTAVASVLMPPLDRSALRLTKGSGTVSDWLAGIPPLWVTTIGARSGERRTVALYGVPVGEDLALLGTSYGRRATPGWAHNLEANPHATVTYRDRTANVNARRATTEEEPGIWATASGVYVGYARYRSWASHRDIRVFILEPVEV